MTTPYEPMQEAANAAVGKLPRSVYADGHAVDLAEHVAERLAAAGLILPHPGRGSDVEHDAYKLAPGIRWDDVYEAAAQVQR